MTFRRPLKNRAAFTLVELLIVIAIIGILVGLLVPTVMYAMKSVKQKAIAIEVQTLANAVDQYKNKYGDYPPDGSSREVFKRHFRKLFPQIQESEFVKVDGISGCSTGVNGYMDPPEALVFALGGFSSDPTKPFTGQGGPLSVVIPQTTPPQYQYNVDRNDPIYEFKPSQLSLLIDVNTGVTGSSDEAELNGGTNDGMPVYRPAGGKLCPFVYFDSRTYGFLDTNTNSYFFNYYPTTENGTARPYRSEQVNTNVSTPSSLADFDKYYRYMNDRGFQLISAGLDDNYGGTPTKIFFTYPSGGGISFEGSKPGPDPSYARYKEGSLSVNAQLDNVANFADGTLGDGLPN